MAKKTMLRQLISKWGVMSTEMQTAYEADSKIIEASENGQLVPRAEEEPLPQIPAEQPAAQIEQTQQPEPAAEPQQIDLSSL